MLGLGRIAQIVKRVAASPSAWYLTRRSIFGGSDFNPERGSASLVPPDGAAGRSPMTLAAFAACVRVLSEDIAKLPIRISKRDGRRSEMVTDSPLWYLLARRPNPYMTSQAFREALMVDALVSGNGFAWIQRDGLGEATALWPIASARVSVIREGRSIRYGVRASQPPDGIPASLYPDEVFHLRNLGDGTVGYSVVEMAAGTLELAAATEVFGTKFFSNGARVAAILTLPPGQAMNDEAAKRFEDSWRAMHTGAINTNKTAILPAGMDFKPLSVPGDQAQFLETRQFQVNEVCRWFRIPPHMIASLDKATFSNIEEQARGYVTEALMPWVKRWESECEAKLLKQTDTAMSISLELKGLLRGTHKDRAEYYSKLFQMGAMTPNEIRELEDMNPVEDGDKPFVQLNLTTLDKVGLQATPAPAPVVDTPDSPDDSPHVNDDAPANQ
jgi:HK97 family phage portal protein